ncbi:TVP38/TMEM64 family protein [Desulfitobacterium sp. AusDCA]|uniref:TVP38/TMEM64 family protein n=1 Tax=Desulfitobacterium sp. AusDCA TaxID=3240383 RepID=UPI003DA7065C
MKDQKLNKKNYIVLFLIMVIFTVLIVLFFYLDRENRLSSLIQNWGLRGIFLSLLLMTALCMTPIPSEGLVILLLKVFGIFAGTLYAWIGSILSSLIIFYLARYFGKSFFQKLITPQRFETVDHWIREKGSLGLLIARLLPIPAFAVNYIAGVMPSVKLWPYIWTAALSIIPYYIGTALVYVGIVQSTWIWLAVGGTAILAFWGISYSLNKRGKPVHNPLH